MTALMRRGVDSTRSELYRVGFVPTLLELLGKTQCFPCMRFFSTNHKCSMGLRSGSGLAIEGRKHWSSMPELSLRRLRCMLKVVWTTSLEAYERERMEAYCAVGYRGNRLLSFSPSLLWQGPGLDKNSYKKCSKQWFSPLLKDFCSDCINWFFKHKVPGTERSGLWLRSGTPERCSLLKIY